MTTAAVKIQIVILIYWIDNADFQSPLIFIKYFFLSTKIVHTTYSEA